MFVVEPREDLENGTRTKPFCMICHPKTGSQSMQVALRKNFKAVPVRGMHYYDESECKRIIDQGGIVACTVRNPWDLMVSWYFYSEHMKQNNGNFPTVLPFKEWLLRVMVAGNGWIERGLFYGAEHCNRIFRFEHDLELQLNNCLTDCGLTPVEFPHVAKTDHKHYSEYYDCETATALAIRFHDEIVEWCYEFNFPKEPE